jgi:hypothetical protein
MMTPIQRINTRIKHGVTAQTLRSEGVLEPYIKNALRLAGISLSGPHLAYQEED